MSRQRGVKVIRQVRPFNKHDTLLVRAYRKRTWIADHHLYLATFGWHVQVQIGSRAWLIIRHSKKRPTKLGVQEGN